MGIDNDREETPPFGFDHKMLWGMGFGPARRGDILDALYEIQQDQLNAGLAVIGIRDLCNWMMPTIDSFLGEADAS